MADGHWNGQQPTMLPTTGMLKRHRSDYEFSPSGTIPNHDMHNYLSQEGSSGGRGKDDTETIGSAYDRYLKNSQISSFTSGETNKFGGDGLSRASLPIADPPVMSHYRAAAPELAPVPRNIGFNNQPPFEQLPRPGRETVPLPPDATNTLYVEGLPSDSTKREVSHIFRPFVGYREVRLVTKESKHRGGEPLILCFVDFENPACAATAMSALQGYPMDEHDQRESHYLRLQFSRFPGPRSSSGGRRKR